MQKNRSITIDMLKTFAIILMIVGHCVVYGSGADNPLGKRHILHHYIYSFHMPLFALVSGYLFYFSVKKRTMKEMFKTRVEGIIIPLIAWQFFMNVYRIVFYAIRDGEWDFLRLIRGYSYLYGNMWFLWAMLFCSLMVMLLHYCFKDNIFAYLIVLLLTFLPYKQEIIRWMWLFPYFSCAFFFAKYKDTAFVKRVYNKVNSSLVFILLFIAHVLMVYFWKMDYYIYTYGYERSFLVSPNILYTIFCAFYRFTAGVIGTVFYALLFKKLKKFLENRSFILKYTGLVSKYTLGIYVFSVYFLNEFIKCMTFLHFNIYIVLVESIIITVLSILTFIYIEKNKWLNILLLGGR